MVARGVYPSSRFVCWASRTPNERPQPTMPDIDQIAPHGGTLVNLLASGAEAEGLRAEAANLPKLAVSDRELADLEMIAVGALSPLTGFQGEADYHSVLDSMHLTNGLPWSIPVTLSIDDDGAHRLGGATAVALTAGEGGEPLADPAHQRDLRPRQGEGSGLGLPHGRPGAPGRRGGQRRRRQVRRRRAPGDRAPAARRLPALPADARRDARRVRRARLEDRRRVPDAQPDPPRARVHPEVRARDRRRPARAPARRRHEGRRRPRGRADALLRGAVRGLLPEGPRDGERVPRRDALRRSRARRSGTRSAARTTAARTSSSAATTPASAATTARTTRSRSSTSSRRASWASRR